MYSSDLTTRMTYNLIYVFLFLLGNAKKESVHESNPILDKLLPSVEGEIKALLALLEGLMSQPHI